MRLGIICRYDEGGLGSQTWEYARHLQADELLMVSVPPPRGEEDAARYAGLLPGHAPLWATFPDTDDDKVWREFASRCDVVLTAETCYRQDFPAICEEHDCRLVIHANSELWEWGRKPPPAITTWAPTRWRLDQLPKRTPVVPVPVDRERCAPREIDEVRRILHVSAPAMMDRAGSLLLAEALSHCEEEFELLIAGPAAPPEPVETHGVTIRGVPPQRNYWDIYADADALVLPRRYGGLSLPMNEAASCGLPVLALPVAPQLDWIASSLRVGGALSSSHARMKGGTVALWRCSPAQLAAKIDLLVQGEHLAEQCYASERYARSIDWARWAPEYRKRLEALA